MKSAISVLLFYGLLVLATAILRGDLTNWPRWADRLASFAVAWSAVILLVSSWRRVHPLAEPASGPPARMLPNWPWWAGVMGFLAFAYFFALPSLSTWLAQPQKLQRPAAGHEAGNPKAAASTEPGTAQTRSVQGGSSPAGEGHGSPASVGSAPEGEGLPGFLGRLWREKPRWIHRLVLVLGLVLIAFLAWLLWRFLRAPADRAVPQPGRQQPWFEETSAPGYVREFARLCTRLGCPPRAGETFRDLLGHLSRDGHDIIELMPMTAYHYRVRYENAAPNRTAERVFTGQLRARQKAPTSAPAKRTATAASAER